MNEALVPAPVDTASAAIGRSPSAATERFELRVTRRFLDALEALSETKALSKADIIRRAVGLYARARMENKDGRMVAFVKLGDDNTVEVKEFIRL